MTDPRPFVLFTQDQCPQCETLKRMLTLPLRGAFDNQIGRAHV